MRDVTYSNLYDNHRHPPGKMEAFHSLGLGRVIQPGSSQDTLELE